LETLGEELRFDVDEVPLLHASEQDPAWSSTYIRERVAEGDVEAAARGLGREHRVEGVVVVGDRRGRELGFPTANLETAANAAIPADGVYAGWLVHGSGRLPAAISIGTNPTFDGTSRRVEAYVLDRDDLSLYGEDVAVDFTARLRDTLRFDSADALVAQMADDVSRARQLTTATS
jgi:riboflavin kinase/FMN adenylyltransferase